ncbi:Nucleoside diphosphate kinase [Poriferisphaera corsica]|uniref:Nucleoside diphosphate kinase n=1 Tax=Poriferisphaera corsica TaxID=2528020 RepID=A0A517YRY7_9BACT|nr:nucleoside-diphosphate kinase [Poriferisphaera corsica]QDU32992.1 Nucleoside diphosphate kinase [Poriferisphaera corsica]
METTFIFVKPDGVQRGLVGEILNRFERKGLQVVGAKMLRVDEDLAGKHYAEHEGKPFYPGLIKFITSSPIMAFAIRGVDAVTVSRTLIGATNGRKADPGTIRGDFGLSGGFNMIHGSDSIESANRELALWFPEGTLEYDKSSNLWTYDPSDLD